MEAAGDPRCARPAGLLAYAPLGDGDSLEPTLSAAINTTNEAKIRQNTPASPKSTIRGLLQSLILGIKTSFSAQTTLELSAQTYTSHPSSIHTNLLPEVTAVITPQTRPKKVKIR